MSRLRRANASANLKAVPDALDVYPDTQDDDESVPLSRETSEANPEEEEETESGDSEEADTDSDDDDDDGGEESEDEEDEGEDADDDDEEEEEEQEEVHSPSARRFLDVEATVKSKRATKFPTGSPASSQAPRSSRSKAKSTHAKSAEEPASVGKKKDAPRASTYVLSTVYGTLHVPKSDLQRKDTTRGHSYLVGTKSTGVIRFPGHSTQVTEMHHV